MITISRSIIRQFRSVLRRAGAFKPHSSLCEPLVLVTDGNGVKIRSQSYDVAIQRELPGRFPDEQIILPQQFLDDCGGRKDVTVTIEQQPDGQIAAQWREGNIPQLLQYAVWSKELLEWPAMPESMTVNEAGLLEALFWASDATDPESSRYALGCVQFQGSSGSLVATDGRQLLVQRGYELPWREDVLAPGSKLFASPELPRDQTLGVGKTDTHLVLAIGPWTVWLRIETQLRFPKTEALVQPPEFASNRCRLSAADAAFLLQSLPHLPCDDDDSYSPVTVDLNGHVAVRSKAREQAQPTEIVLCESTQEGEPQRFNMNRVYLQRAVRMGLHDFCFVGDGKAIQARDERRIYLWMPLDKSGAIPPSPEAIRIESQTAGAAAAVPEPKPRKKRHMKDKPTSAAAKTACKARINKQTVPPDTVAADDNSPPIEQAKQLRANLREMLSQANQLIASLRRQQKHSKAVASTLASLKQLERISA